MSAMTQYRQPATKQDFDAETRRMAKWYREGLSLREIGRRVGLSGQGVHYRIRELVTMRLVGKRRGPE